MTGNQLFNLAKADDLSLVGGKAYALGLMARAGFNVPDGFVLSSSAFMAMTNSLGVQILARVDELRADFLAVRSSAINEDSTDATWAGQLDTFLNCTKDNLLESIEACWKSASSERAQAYAEQKGLQSTGVAVIVQKMIQSEVSGIAFSAHPVTNDKRQVVIEAGLGLGEATVSGQITPDTYIVDKETKQIANKYVAEQKEKLTQDRHGNTTWQDIGARGGKQKLTDGEIAKLCDLTSKLEDFFNYPVDIEWALNKGMLYVLQCRPITTLPHS